MNYIQPPTQYVVYLGEINVGYYIKLANGLAFKYSGRRVMYAEETFESLEQLRLFICEQIGATPETLRFKEKATVNHITDDDEILEQWARV